MPAQSPTPEQTRAVIDAHDRTAKGRHQLIEQIDEGEQSIRDLTEIRDKARARAKTASDKAHEAEVALNRARERVEKLVARLQATLPSPNAQAPIAESHLGKSVRRG